MKKARVAYAGAIHDAFPLEASSHDAGAHNISVRLADGRVVAESDVVWLPPFEVGKVIALGLNYADHAKELAFSKQQTEPLAFLKSPQAVIGHNGQTRRSGDATFMHYECELAIVVGKTAHQVSEARALDYVAGYTVANDYVIRDYLENWYRPNLRAKNRDTLTVLGPWLVDAADVADPCDLALTTRVNGEITQQGSTRDMIFNVPWLISWLSDFMTLTAGDVILTGTPKGVVDVHAGDEVITEIEGLGSLRSHIVDDGAFGIKTRQAV